MKGFARIIIVLLGFGLVGCGFKDLPHLKQESEQALKDVLIQYRLRADVVPQMMKLVEGRHDKQWPQLMEKMKRSHGQAVAMDIPLSQLNEKQLNRMASFQHALSSALVDFVAALDADAQVQKNGELASVKEQLARADARIAQARQKYLAIAPNFNEMLKKTPHKWFNSLVYKYEPALLIQ